ncbi:MAG: hypothetical protein V8R85_10370 [Frisingicoccus sp.]
MRPWPGDMECAAAAEEGTNEMIITHICSALMIFYPIYEDLKTKKISIAPALCLMAAGMLVKAVGGGLNGEGLSAGGSEMDAAACFLGMLPGILLFVVGQIFGNCIGEGDCILIVGAGLLEGVIFCGRMLAVTACGIFIYSVVMLAFGKLGRKSKVACVPFLALGYMGAWFL